MFSIMECSEFFHRFPSFSMLTIRAATIADALLLRSLIGELASFEKAADQVSNTAEGIARDGFGAQPAFRALIAEWNGETAGFALFFNSYSTWRGPGLFLEDLFVRDDFRGRGIGKTLLAHIARLAVEENRVSVKWEVLGWNQPAIEMYKALGTEFLDDWRSVVLTGDELRKLAEKTS
jgi:GNAT superfamily N-acetyltransferase